MRTSNFWKIGYWLLGSLVIATLIFKSIGGFLEAWLVSLFLLTAAVFVKYSYQYIAHLKGFRKVLRVFLIAMVSLYWSYIAITIAYWYLIELKGGVIDQIIVNPIFIWMIIGFFVLLEYRVFRKPNAPIKETVSIYSDRKKTVLRIESIAYIESRSDFTIAVLSDGKEYKNNTPISEWAKMLDSFIRIHRAFLVNPKKLTLNGNEVLVDSKWTLSVSRKYKQEVIERLETLSKGETP
jgi:hypothetical protein